MDCELNGVCDPTTRQCKCSGVWTGPSCGSLRLIPPEAVVAAYPPPELRQTVSSWGGSVLSPGPESKSGSKWTMVVSELANGCGLNAWSTNSQLVLAEADAPDGPYQRVGLVSAPFATNPRIVEAPDGTFLVFHIGCSGTGGQPCTSCGGGVTKNCPGTAQHTSCSLNGTQIAYSSSRDGPWKQFNAEVLFGPAWVGDGQGGFDNPTILFFPNGSLLALGRDSIYDVGRADESASIGVITAPSWRGPYTCHHQIGQPGAVHVEDAFVWQDAGTGHFHFLAHKFLTSAQPRTRAGAHGFSVDGWSWTVSTEDAYPHAITTADGVAHPFSGHRDRPELIFNRTTGEPTHLITATGFLDPGNDHVFTFVQALDGGGSA